MLELFRRHIHLRASGGGGRAGTVVLVHGLFRSALSMFFLGRFLSRHGWDVRIYDYLTTRKLVRAHAADFHEWLKILILDNPGGNVAIVTHSLGSIVTREAMRLLEEETPPGEEFPVSKIVMLAPPNKGSHIARDVTAALPPTRLFVRPLHELSSAPDSPIHGFHKPGRVPVGIVAAGRDTKVTAGLERLETEAGHTVVDCGHSFIMDNRAAREAVLKFLSENKF